MKIMNKYLLLLLLLFIPSLLLASGKNKEPYVYKSINEVSLTKAEIISYSSQFIAQKFVSGKSVIELKDKELGKIVGNIVLMNKKAKFFHAFKGISGNMTISAKKGKFKFEMASIVGTDGKGKKANFGELEGANRYRIEPMTVQILDEFVLELKNYLSKAKASDDDW